MVKFQPNSPAIITQESVDVDMETSTADADVEVTGSNAVENGHVLPSAAEKEEDVKEPTRVTYLDYLASPIVQLRVTEGDKTTILRSHEALLKKSPFFLEACAQLGPTAARIIDLTEPADAVGCFLEFLYTGEYFPQKIANTHRLINDPTAPDLDTTGDQLLKHARVYVLAEKFGMIKLKELAHSKVHCVKSSAKGEIAYARYVYATTPKEDSTIRKPVASFWAHRSHVLRTEAEEEFRQICLEFPQFSFDVITRLLDEKAKNERMEKPSSGSPSGTTRKRARQSTIA